MCIRDRAWGVPEEKLPLEEGYKLTDLGHLVDEGKVHCFYNYGEDPVQTEPDSVSYTHLDVYKRQRHRRSGRGRGH